VSHHPNFVVVAIVVPPPTLAATTINNSPTAMDNFSAISALSHENWIQFLDIAFLLLLLLMLVLPVCVCEGGMRG